MRGKQVKDYLGHEAVRAWLIMAAIFAALAAIGLWGEWDGLTRSGIIGGSTALMAGFLAIGTCLLKGARLIR